MRSVSEWREMRSGHSMPSALEDVNAASNVRFAWRRSDARLVLHNEAKPHDKGFLQEARKASCQRPSRDEPCGARFEDGVQNDDAQGAQPQVAADGRWNRRAGFLPSAGIRVGIKRIFFWKFFLKKVFLQEPPAGGNSESYNHLELRRRADDGIKGLQRQAAAYD